MKQMCRAFSLGLLLLLSGCFRITYHVASPGGEIYKNRYWNTYFVCGLIPVEESYGFDSFCRNDQLIEVRSYQSPANVIATLFGVMTAASTVEAVCIKDGSKLPPPPPPSNLQRFPRFYQGK